MKRRELNVFVIALGSCGLMGLIETGSVHAMQTAAGRGNTWPYSLGMTLPSWLLLAITVPAIPRLARRFSFDQRNWRKSVLVHAFVSTTIGLAHLAAMSLTYVLLSEPATWERLIHIFGVCFRYLFLAEVLAYWAFVGTYLAIHYSNLRTSLAEARLLALRTQLNPHFLFNTLHAISTLALKGEHAAVAESLGQLSDLLRTALDGRAQEIPLSMELDFIDHYMALQRIRLADRLNVDKAIAPEALASLIPTMLLQPIVENAIKHGVVAQRGPGRINISAERTGNQLVVEVHDTGPGFPSTGQQDGIGLGNTRARLEQLYGANYRLECGPSPNGGAAVRIAIPYHEHAA